MLAIVSAFENPTIFRLITGQATKGMKTVQAGAKLRKEDEFAMADDHVKL